MDKEKTKSLLQAAYERVQNLQMAPTKHNVTIIAEVLAALEEAFGEVSAAPEAVETPEAGEPEEEETDV